MQASLTLRPSATRVFAAKKVQVRSAIDPMHNARQRDVQRCQRRAHASRECMAALPTRLAISGALSSGHQAIGIAPNDVAMPLHLNCLPRRRRHAKHGAQHIPPLCPKACCLPLFGVQVRAAAGMKVMAYKVTLQTPDGEQVRRQAAGWRRVLMPIGCQTGQLIDGTHDGQ